jgi:GT2 family glycosyltransferase
VDDGSAQECVSRMAAEFEGVTCLRRPRSGGFCAAANAGINSARGEIVELLNDDAEVTSGWAEAALAHFATVSVAAVAPLVLCWPGQPARIDSAGDRYFAGGFAGKRGRGLDPESGYRQARRVFGASASSAFYRRDLLMRLGGFPERFGAYFEDVDLSFRLHRAGGEIVYEPSSRVLHRVSASYGRPNRRLMEQQSRNEELVFWRNLPTRDLLRALPLHLAVLAGKAWRRHQEGQFVPWFAGRLRALSETVQVMRHRRWLRTLGHASAVQDWGVEWHWDYSGG